MKHLYASKTKNMKNKQLRICCLLLCVLSSTLMFAEYNHELGLTGGTAFYLGDANHKTPFEHSRWSTGAFYRYNFDTRWAMKLHATFSQVAGDTRDFGYTFPTWQEYAAFQRQFFNLDAAAEFNFFDIGESKYYKASYHATPYLVLGVGLTAYNAYGPGGHMFHVSIPFGIGGKWKPNKRLTIGIEWTIHKLFADDLDVTGKENSILNDPYKTGKIGFLDTDWFSLASLYISFSMFEIHKYCK